MKMGKFPVGILQIFSQGVAGHQIAIKKMLIYFLYISVLKVLF